MTRPFRDVSSYEHVYIRPAHRENHPFSNAEDSINTYTAIPVRRMRRIVYAHFRRFYPLPMVVFDSNDIVASKMGVNFLEKPS